MFRLAHAVFLTIFLSACAADRANTKEDAMPAPCITGPAGPLAVDDGGTGGLPVVFIHSFAGSKAHWAAALAHLRKSRRAVAMDLRGHGDSAAPAHDEYTVDALAEDIAAGVDGIGLERFVLVGHSLGGAAAIAYAGAHPERVAGLVLVGTPGSLPSEQSCQLLAALEADYETVMEEYRTSILTGAQPSVATQLHNEMKSMPRDTSLAIIGAIFAYDPLPDLEKFPGPKLLLDTGHGESPTSLHHLAPDVPRQLVNGTSHWPHLDKPREFNRLLDGFLAKIS